MTEREPHQPLTGRDFPENGIKRLLQHPANVRDLLELGAPDMAEKIDFERAKSASGTVVDVRFRRRECDVLLTAPLRSDSGATGREVIVYILIEHQSVRDPLMPLRLLGYVVRLLERQEEEWRTTPREKRRRSKLGGSLRLQPVLPVVFYTGESNWDSPGQIADLMVETQTFARVAPELRPVFVSLEALSGDQLESEGGALGCAQTGEGAVG